MEYLLRNIKQQYEKTTNLNKYQKKNKQEEKKLRERRKTRNPVLRMNILENAREISR